MPQQQQQQMSNSNFINNIKKSVGNKIFNVTFIKKNGSVRIMTCRLNVNKYCGNNPPTVDTSKYLVAFEMGKKQYRNINVESILWIKFQKNTYSFPASSDHVLFDLEKE